MKPVRTWILIADAGRARVLENLGPGKGVHEVVGMVSHTDLPRTHDIVTDRRTRVQESGNATRHAIEAKTDPHEQLKQQSLEAVAARIDEKLAADAFDRLVVVAPPHVLGILRGAFSSRVQAAVTGELGKDLTKTPDHELAGHLADFVRI